MGEFRQDLFYRIDVLTIPLPSLVERREDIPVLLDHLLERMSDREGAPLRITPAAAAFLARQSWPGNIRQLENCLRSAALLGEGPQLDVGDFAFLEASARVEVAEVPLRERERRMAEAAWRQSVEEALERTSGRVREAAAVLAVSPRTLYRRMEALGIHARDYRRTS